MNRIDRDKKHLSMGDFVRSVVPCIVHAGQIASTIPLTSLAPMRVSRPLSGMTFAISISAVG